jgi:hypothetical protein
MRTTRALLAFLVWGLLACQESPLLPIPRQACHVLFPSEVWEEPWRRTPSNEAVRGTFREEARVQLVASRLISGLSGDEPVFYIFFEGEEGLYASIRSVIGEVKEPARLVVPGVGRWAILGEPGLLFAFTQKGGDTVFLVSGHPRRLVLALRPVPGREIRDLALGTQGNSFSLVYGTRQNGKDQLGVYLFGRCDLQPEVSSCTPRLFPALSLPDLPRDSGLWSGFIGAEGVDDSQGATVGYDQSQRGLVRAQRHRIFIGETPLYLKRSATSEAQNPTVRAVDDEEGAEEGAEEASARTQDSIWGQVSLPKSAIPDEFFRTLPATSGPFLLGEGRAPVIAGNRADSFLAVWRAPDGTTRAARVPWTMCAPRPIGEREEAEIEVRKACGELPPRGAAESEACLQATQTRDALFSKRRGGPDAARSVVAEAPECRPGLPLASLVELEQPGLVQSLAETLALARRDDGGFSLGSFSPVQEVSGPTLTPLGGLSWEFGDQVSRLLRVGVPVVTPQGDALPTLWLPKDGGGLRVSLLSLGFSEGGSELRRLTPPLWLLPGTEILAGDLAVTPDTQGVNIGISYQHKRSKQVGFVRVYCPIAGF